MTTPNDMPRKASIIHQQILGALVENKRGLARNVSTENVERAAARWAVGLSSPANAGEAAARRWMR